MPSLCLPVDRRFPPALGPSRIDPPCPESAITLCGSLRVGVSGRVCVCVSGWVGY